MKGRLQGDYDEQHVRRARVQGSGKHWLLDLLRLLSDHALWFQHRFHGGDDGLLGSHSDRQQPQAAPRDLPSDPDAALHPPLSSERPQVPSLFFQIHIAECSSPSPRSASTPSPPASSP